MFGIWTWIEEAACAAFLRGIQKAVDKLQSAEADAAPAPVLRLSFTPPEKEPEGETGVVELDRKERAGRKAAK